MRNNVFVNRKWPQLAVCDDSHRQLFGACEGLKMWVIEIINGLCAECARGFIWSFLGICRKENVCMHVIGLINLTGSPCARTIAYSGCECSLRKFD